MDNRKQLLIDLLRNAKGVGETIRTVGQGALAEIPAGMSGLGTMMATGDLDKSAEAVRATRDALAYTPSADADKYLEGIGKGIDWAGGKLKQLPGAGQAQEGWEGLTQASPLLGAAIVGTAGVLDPTKGAGRAAGAVERAVPKAVLELGTRKAAREAATSKRLTAQRDIVVEKQKGAGKRAKVAPDVYRKLYEAEGEAPVLAAAKAGEHLKPQPGGGYVGAPRTVRTAAQLGALRRSLDEQLAGGAEALQFADPERVGNWYDRAKAAQAETSEPWQLPRTLEEHAVYSAGVAPESELAFALKHRNQQALGTGERAYREAGKKTLTSAVAQNRPAKLAPKVGEYRGKNDPTRVERSPFGVNDFRMAQAYGYTDPTGAPWKAGASETMHPFMDAETALMVDRARQRGIGGRSDWTGAQVQEIPWVLNKAEDIYGRGRKGRFSAKNFGGDEIEAKAAALRDANQTIADYLPKHTMSVTSEAVPGANTGHMSQIIEAPFEERQAYGRRGSWTQPTDTQPSEFGAIGAGDRDMLYSALGFRQRPAIEAVGNYTNSAGVVEQNPMTISRPLVDFETGTQQGVNPNTQRALEATETFRGVADAQEAVAANMPVTMAGRKGKMGLLAERSTPPTRDEMAALSEALRGTPFEGNASATDRGLMMFNFADDPAKAQRAMLKQRELVEEAMPGAQLTKAGNEGLYLPAMSRAEEAGQGIATSRVLERMAAAPEQVALNISESEAVRKALREKIARDAELGGGRADIEKTRKFFAEADWPRAVAMMRKGMTPAAALAAMGYSMSGMAAETE